MATIRATRTEKKSKAKNGIADMTVGELRDLIRETVREALLEMVDPDEGLEFRPEIAARIEKALREQPRGVPVAEARRRLGLNG